MTQKNPSRHPRFHFPERYPRFLRTVCSGRLLPQCRRLLRSRLLPRHSGNRPIPRTRRKRRRTPPPSKRRPHLRIRAIRRRLARHAKVVHHMLSQLILAMAKRALPHRAVASSLGLALHVLRRYFAPELICGAPLCQINRRRHPPPARRPPRRARKTTRRRRTTTKRRRAPIHRLQQRRRTQRRLPSFCGAAPCAAFFSRFSFRKNAFSSPGLVTYLRSSPNLRMRRQVGRPFLIGSRAGGLRPLPHARRTR